MTLQYILFDLDNTLYSARYGLELNVGRRIADYLAAYLGVSPEEAIRQRQERIHCYGTTLEWLMAEKGFTDVEAYYAAIHPAGEADALSPDPGLRRFLEGLPLPRGILTNSPREHADRILAQLGIPDLFTHIFDIRWSGFTGKPHREVFLRALDILGTTPETTLFIDDTPRCVTGYCALGGKGVLLDEADAYPGYPHPRIRTLQDIFSLIPV
ncbi:MAG: HAD-IA family hydrolase [Treponema sp.]|jgi:putative hydrolase of the HAD superfamily|nr:HAD-IA family hydrolase [Treponema sp.]